MKVELHIHHHGLGCALAWDRVLEALQAMERRIMTGISDFAAAQTAFNTELASDLQSISDQLAALNAQIATLQNSPGPITPADQATLDSLQAAGLALETKADALAGKTAPTPPAA